MAIGTLPGVVVGRGVTAMAGQTIIGPVQGMIKSGLLPGNGGMTDGTIAHKVIDRKNGLMASNARRGGSGILFVGVAGRAFDDGVLSE